MRKQFIKRTCILLSLLLCLFSFPAVGVAAKESVTYQGDQKTILVEGNSGIDLFASEMKSLLPGDVKEKDIYLGNKGTRTITFYLLAQDSEMTSQEKAISDKLMNQITIKVELVQTAGSRKTIYEGPATGNLNGTGSTLKNAISLGTLGAKKTMSLHLTASVPDTLSNEYQALTGKVDWLFYCQGTSGGGGGGGGGGGSSVPGTSSVPEEDIPEESVPLASQPEIPENPDVVIIVDDDTPLGNLPQTGGMNGLNGDVKVIGPVVFLTVAGCALMCCIVRKKKKEQ